LRHLIVLSLKSLLEALEMAIRYVPGGLGYKIRSLYYQLRLRKMGRNVLIGTGVFLNGPRNISLGDFVWIEANSRVEAMLGEVSIGRRVHVGPFSIIYAREPVTIGDYVDLSSCVRIYSSSEHPVDGKRMNVLMPEEWKGVIAAPITLHKDSFVGTGGVLLPGAELGEGAVVGANSVVSTPVAPQSVVLGVIDVLLGVGDAQAQDGRDPQAERDDEEQQQQERAGARRAPAAGRALPGVRPADHSSTAPGTVSIRSISAISCAFSRNAAAPMNPSTCPARSAPIACSPSTNARVRASRGSWNSGSPRRLDRGVPTAP
jgi:acetyltransferase-like isoleucine patch superfamily enzyme